MAARSIISMHFTQERQEREKDATLARLAFKARLQARIEEAHELWGSAWDNWWNVFLDDHDGAPWGELYEALGLEIERRQSFPVDGDALQNWVAAMADVDRLADEHSPDTAAAIKIEETAHQIYLNGSPAKRIDQPEAMQEITP